MSSKLKVTTVCFAIIFIAMVSCTSNATSNTTESSEVRKCKPNFCDVVRCMSAEPCNGTLIKPNGPCECCTKCIKFKGEGEACESDSQSDIPDSTSTTTAKAVVTATDLKSTNENLSEKVNSCKPGLTCLMGTCVVLL